MFNKFIKKSSKFFAVLLTATLAFTPLSYGATPATSFSNFQTLISDGTAVSDGTITVDSIQAGETEINKDAVLQDYDNLTIKKEGDSNGYINAGGEEYHNAGFEIKEGQTTEINGITFANFYKDKSWELNHKKNPPEWELVDGGEGAVVFNHSGYLTINDSKFSGNETSAQDEMAFGGAIGHNSSKNGEGVRIGKLTVIGSTFTSNKSMASGAINSTGILEIQNSKFEGNSASMGAGALGMFGHENETSIINNTEFTSNSTNGFGGAIASGGAVDLTITNSQFTGNSANDEGGAITNRPISEEVDYSYAYLTIDGSAFNNNLTYGKGGAIDNYYYQSKNGETINNYVSVTNTDFIENQAGKGGAIYNHKYYETHEVGEDEYEPNENPTSAKMLIENATFTGNSATENGGAIYNEGEMTIKESEFSGNTANGTPNDIYNVGTLSFLSGITTMTGGILGTGSTIIGNSVDTAKLLLGEDATLEQNTLTVEKNSELSAYITAVNITDKIINNGLITINGDGEMTTVSFEGTGKIVYTGNIEYDENVEIDTNIEQSTVTVSADKTLTIGDGGTVTTNSIGGGADSGIEVEQGGKLVLNLNEESTFGVESLTGNGTFEINVDNIEESKTLDFTDKTISVSTIVATGDKHLVFNGASIQSDIINNTTGESLELQNTTVEGDIYNYPGSPDTTMGDGKPVIDINNNVTINGKITNSSGTINVWSDFNVRNVITSTQTENIAYNVLNIGDAEHYAAVQSTATIEYQTINVSSGSLALVDETTTVPGGTIKQSSVNVTSSGSLTANASRIQNTSIQNDGDVTFTGGTNNNEITGAGKLTINSSGLVVENAQGVSVEQTNGIEIAEDGSFKAFADDIKAAVTNNGTYDITGGTISYRITGGETRGFVDIKTAEVKISSAISNSQVRLSTNVVVDKEEFLGDTTSDLTVASGVTINMLNSSTGTATLNSITVNPTEADTQWTLLIDADLAAEQADNFNVIDTVATNSINAFVNTLNITNDFAGDQVSAELQISNKNIGLLWTAASNIISTSLNDYIVEAVNNDSGSFLIVTLQGLLTLPQAIAQGESSYIVRVAEDVVGSWIIDSEGVHNFLIEDLEITGNNKIIKSSTTATSYLDGINVSTKTLTINNLASFEGFENALKVEKLSDTEVGHLNLSTVTFRNNTGDAVIDNEGIATLSGVTFEENTATIDINNSGELVITATAGETSFEKGIVGVGTTTVSGATVNFGGDAKFEQASISIEEGSEVTVNAANVKVTGINNILYNSGSLVLYSTATDTIDFANPIMDVISVGTTTIKTTTTDNGTIGANINMGDKDLQQYGLVIQEGSSLTVNAGKLNISSQVVNDGSLTFKSATAATDAMVNKSTITTNGTGSLTIDGIVTNQEGTGISEANIFVLQNSSFTASANDLTVSSEEGISNEGNLIFKSESDEQTNENNISGNGKFFIDGSLINKAEVNQSSVTIGASIESMVINEGAIVSTNVVINEGSTLVAKGEIDTYDEGKDGKITNNGTFIINVLTPEGKPDTVPNYNTIDGTGTLIISSTNFNVQDNATISQSSVTIADVDSSLTVGVSSLTITSPDGAVQNAGKFTLTGEGTNNNKVEGYNDNYGETVFAEGSVITNNASINQSTVTVLGTVINTANAITATEGVVINGNGSLTTSASDITGKIENNKDLIFTAGTNNNVIVGTGTLTINGVVINGNTESTIRVSQSSVTISGAESQLYNVGEITTNYLTGEGELENQAKLILNLSEDAGYGLAKLTGSVGVSSITVEAGKSVTLNNTGTIQQATIETYGAGSLLLTGNKIIANIVNYMTGNCLDLATRIEGTLDNNPANEETEGVVNILDGGSISGLITNSTGTINITSTGFEVETGITSANTSDITKNKLNIGSGTVAGVVRSSNTIEYQTITISSGSLTMKSGDTFGIIDNSSITIKEDGTLAIHVSSMTGLRNVETGLTEDANVINDGTLILYGNNTETDNNNNIINANEKGNLIIEGNINNVEGTTINQSTVTVTAVSTFTANANDITTNKGIVNDGLLTFVGAEDTVNTSTITTSNGNGKLVIASSEVANSANITQKDIVIEADSELENNIATIVATSSVTVKETGKIENAGIIEAEYLINNGEVENGDTDEEEGGTINVIQLENNKTVTNSTGTINANVFNNNMDAKLNNGEYGVIVSTNVVNNGAIASSGSITAYRFLENAHIATIINSSGTITAKQIDNNGLVENEEKATIDAEIIYNYYGGTINSTGTIKASDVIINEGEITSYGTSLEDGTYEGGTITSANTAVNRGTVTANASGVDAKIQNENGGIYNITGGTVTKDVSGANGGTVNIKQSSVTLAEDAFISQNTINLEGTEFKLEKESNLRTSDLNIGEGATFNIMNDSVDTVDINSLNVGDGITWNFKFDVNLKLGTTDTLINTNFANTSTMTINTINVLEDSDKATTTKLTIADSYSWADVSNPIYATTNVKYTIEQDLSITTATVLGITSEGYGGFPSAVYDGLGLYFVSGDSEGVHIENVKKWVDDGHGPQDTLIADMSLNGLYADSVLVSSPDAGTLTGVKTGSFTLRINDNEEAKGLTIKGFENAITVNVPDGRLEANNVVFSSNTGTAIITNEGTTVLNGVTFDDTNTATYDVLNNGNVLLETSSSTFTKGIVGEGTTTIKGIAIDMGDATLAQGTVEISHVEGSSLTVKVDKLQYEREGSSEATVTGLIINNNELVLIGNEDNEVATLATEIKGFGNTELQKNMDVTKDISQTNINLIGATVSVSTETGAKLKATTISVDENSSLTADASNIDTFATNGGINNEGIVTFVGGTNNNTITGDQGKVFIEMNKEVINSTGTQILQQYIEVKEGGKFVMNADDVETATDDASGTNMFGIQNNGDLEITGGTNKNIIQRGDAVKGNTIISGIVTNAEGTSVEQSTITVNSGASLTANANDLKKATNGIINSGDLIFVGSSDMTNENDITGTGNLTIKSNLTSSTTITQTNIDIVGGTFTHNVADNGDLPKITAANVSVSTSATFITHSEVVVSDKITNDGIFKINVLKPTGEADDVTSQNNIIGKGDMIISSTNYKNNGGTISQKTLTIEDADSSFETDITKFEAYNGITDNGNLIYTGTGTSSSTITGTGELTIGTADTTAEVVNKEGNEISLSTITVNEGSKFTANANDITTTVGMVNDAEVTFTGGVNKSTITMTNDNGKMIVEGTYFENTAAITQSTINVTNNMFNNVRGSSITATSFNADTTFVTDAYDLNISTITLGTTNSLLKLMDDEIQGTEIELDSAIDGSGSLVKEGSAIVTLNGENSYTGTTTITDGALRISSSTNISDRDGAIIYMDGGKLIAAGDMELNSDIVGTFGTDGANTVNIEVEDVFVTTLTANSTIYGSSDIVKTGSGTLNLEMESNSYTGDTKISSGTIRGTTKNINGIVTGNNDGTAVEFYDDADIQGDVVLNKIVDMGAFRKTGTSTMTVTNAFKAITANISNGTLIMNNADVDGNKITDFTVDSSMTVTNATLKGYGNITAKDLIIGQGATFAPGNSTTTFKVTGNLAFEEDGNYDVEFGQINMDEAGHYNDNTTVSGTTTIGDNAKITLNNLEGKYYVPETIELINSGTLADGYEYQEDNVTFNDNDATDLRPGYDTRISTRVYTEGNILKIDLQRKQSEYSDAIEFERSHNEQEAANAIDAISSGNGGDITNPLDAMEKMYYYQETYDIDGLKAALNDIAGVIHANSTMLTFMNDKIEHVYDKVQERSKCLLPCQKVHDKIWAEYYYNTYNVKENENSPKFDTSVNGFLVGFDMISAKNLTLGLMAGYGTSELKQEQDKTTMNDINFGFYGGYETNKWLFKGMLLGGYEQYDTTRTIGFMDRVANSEHNGYSASLDLEAGYKISLNKDAQAKHKMYLKPYLGVTGSYMMNEGFEEKDAQSLNLKVEDYNAMTAQARAGIGINGKIKKFGWYAKAGVRQYLTEDYNEIELALLDYKDQTKMKIRSAELDKFSYGGGIGADFALSSAWTVFANGLVSFADKSNNYYGNIGLMYKFGCPNNEKKTDEDVEKITAMLNDKMTEEELLKKQLAEKEKALNDAKKREKELQDRIQKYEANIVSEQEAQKMKEKTIKTMRLGEKPTFVFGTDKLNGSGKESLKQVARELESYPEAEVLVEGHTDNVGGDEINQKISENRASAVATTLKKDYGVKNNISVIGKGKTEPIASNDTAEGRAKNRRVEIIVTTND